MKRKNINFKKPNTGEALGRAIAMLVIWSFMYGTIFWAAVDVFALFTENQFTGRMRAFDVEYWDAIRGTAFVIVTSAFANAVGSIVSGKVNNTEGSD